MIRCWDCNSDDLDWRRDDDGKYAFCNDCGAYMGEYGEALL